MLLKPLSKEDVDGNVGGGVKVNGAVLSCARAVADVGRVERYLVDQVEARKVSQLAEACGLFAYSRRADFHQVLSLVLFFLACFGVLTLFGLVFVLPRVCAFWRCFQVGGFRGEKQGKGSGKYKGAVTRGDIIVIKPKYGC